MPEYAPYIETLAHLAAILGVPVVGGGLLLEAYRFRRLQAAEHRGKLADRGVQLLHDHDASFDRDAFRFRALAAGLEATAVGAVKAGEGSSWTRRWRPGGSTAASSRRRTRRSWS